MTLGSNQDVGQVVVHCTGSRNTRPFCQPLKSTYTQWLRPHPESRVTQSSHRLLKSGLCIDRGWSSSLMARNHRIVFVFHSCTVHGLIILWKGMTPRLGAPWNGSALMWLLWLLHCDLWLKGSSWPPKLSSIIAGTGRSRHRPWVNTHPGTHLLWTGSPSPFHHFLSSLLSAWVSRWINSISQNHPELFEDLPRGSRLYSPPKQFSVQSGW